MDPDNLIKRLDTLIFVVVDAGTSAAMAVIHRLKNDIIKGDVPADDPFWGQKRIE